MIRFSLLLGIGCIVSLAAPAFAVGPTWINGVPDWNQPSTYGDFVQPLDPPPQAGGVANWCTPTAGANVMGYYEDVMGQVGVGDGLVAPNAAAYPNNDTDAGSSDLLPDYQQNQWRDGMIEMGYFMDTQGWLSNVAHFGTSFGAGVADCPNGISSYLNTYAANPNQWTVWNYDIFNGGNAGLSWSDYLTGGLAPTLPVLATVPQNGVMLDEPVLVTLDTWVDIYNPNKYVDENNIEWYDWSSNEGGGHTVTGIGYATDYDPDDGGPLPSGNWMLAHDGWGTTGPIVAVPWDTYFENSLWWGNTHVELVPEPGTWILLTFAALAGILFFRRKK
ncbi:MAG: PEP-CTERM sorting domain-containing protein [Pirellulales bacterium]|nr:PEP-CTERM sorting domain-containing protein [Pirellulales bacterium]